MRTVLTFIDHVSPPGKAEVKAAAEENREPREHADGVTRSLYVSLIVARREGVSGARGAPLLFVAKAVDAYRRRGRWPPTSGGARSGSLFIDCETEESSKIAFVFHVGRAHELEYLQATGNVPTPDHLRLQEYLVREGFHDPLHRDHPQAPARGGGDGRGRGRAGEPGRRAAPANSSPRRAGAGPIGPSGRRDPSGVTDVSGMNLHDHAHATDPEHAPSAYGRHDHEAPPLGRGPPSSSTRSGPSRSRRS